MEAKCTCKFRGAAGAIDEDTSVSEDLGGAGWCVAEFAEEGSEAGDSFGASGGLVEFCGAG